MWSPGSLLLAVRLRPSDQIGRRPRNLRIATVASALLSVLLAPGARAEDDGSRFSLSFVRLPGASKCIPPNTLARRIEERLGRPVFVAPARADVSVEGYVEWKDTTYHAFVSIADRDGIVLGQRDLSSSDATCRELDGPLALTMALLIDPNAALSPEGTEHGPPARRAPPPLERPVKPTPTPVSPPPARDDWRTSIEAGGGLGIGLLPDLANGLILRAGVMPPRGFRTILDGAFWSEEERTPSGSASSVGFSLAQGGLSVCPVEGETAVFRAHICAGLTAGLLSTRGLYDGAILVRRRFTAAAIVRSELVAKIGSHVFFGLGAGASTPFVRDSFEYERDLDRVRVFRMSAAAAVFDLTLGFQSPR